MIVKIHACFFGRTLRLSLLLAGLLISANNATNADSAGAEQHWDHALAKWEKFSKEHLDRMRALEATIHRPNHKFDMRWTERKSPVISKYLPGFKIYSDTRYTFVLGDNGRIICLNEAWPPGHPFASAPDLELQSIAEFLKLRKIKILNPESAIGLIKLKGDIEGVGAVDDEFRIEYSRNYSLRAKQEGRSWIVQALYVGPPAMRIVHPDWRITVDNESLFVAITEEYPQWVDDIHEYSEDEVSGPNAERR